MATKQQFQPPSTEFLKKLGYRFSRMLLSYDNMMPENYMWRGVVINALEDTMIERVDRKSAVLKGAAHNWIMSACSDFDQVCNWAMLDPDDVRAAYKKAILKNKIRFKQSQVKWKKYSLLLNKWQKACSVAQKSSLKKQLKLSRREAVLGSNCYVTIALVSVIVS